MVESVSMRKTWAVSGLLSSGRVGSTEERSDRPLGFHSPRGEWGRWKQIDRWKREIDRFGVLKLSK
jgi:hypothetical protein